MESESRVPHPLVERQQTGGEGEGSRPGDTEISEFDYPRRGVSTSTTSKRQQQKTNKGHLVQTYCDGNRLLLSENVVCSVRFDSDEESYIPDIVRLFYLFGLSRPSRLIQ